MSDNPRKRRLYIVGGKGKNIPAWLSEAFDYEQFDQDNAKTRTLEPTEAPDAVVCLKSWVGHEHWYGARDLAERLGVPFINSAGGWSGSIKAADDLGVEWFIQGIERAKSSDDVEVAEKAEEFVDNAWRGAYEREYEARQALEKRYGRDRRKFEAAQAELEKLKEQGAAAQRVIVEIRAAAAAQRTALEKINAASEQRAHEIQERSERVAKALSEHMASLMALFEASDISHEALLAATNKLNTARALADEKLAILKASLAVAEGGVPSDLEQTAKASADS